MTLLYDLTGEPPSGECLIRIYQGRQVSFSAEAVRLLGMDDGSKVAFKTGAKGSVEAERVFVGVKSVGYPVHRRGKCYRIWSTSLAKALAGKLQGYGTYRIEADNRVLDPSGTPFYSVFFRKYD